MTSLLADKFATAKKLLLVDAFAGLSHETFPVDCISDVILGLSHAEYPLKGVQWVPPEPPEETPPEETPPEETPPEETPPEETPPEETPPEETPPEETPPEETPPEETPPEETPPEETPPEEVVPPFDGKPPPPSKNFPLSSPESLPWRPPFSVTLVVSTSRNEQPLSPINAIKQMQAIRLSVRPPAREVVAVRLVVFTSIASTFSVSFGITFPS